MKTWFTSDPHFYHTNVIKYCDRPYSTVEEMNEDLIRKWNETVSPEDTVICVGDFAMAFRPVETFTPRLNGRKILVAGNHDWCHPAHKKSRTPENQQIWIQKYLDNGWAEVHMQMRMEIGGKVVNIAHLPYLEENSQEDLRHSKHRLTEDGTPLICGHIHEKWKTRVTNGGTLMVNVGVDVWGMKPVSLEEVEKIINGT